MSSSLAPSRFSPPLISKIWQENGELEIGFEIDVPENPQQDLETNLENLDCESLGCRFGEDEKAHIPFFWGNAVEYQTGTGTNTVDNTDVTDIKVEKKKKKDHTGLFRRTRHSYVALSDELIRFPVEIILGSIFGSLGGIILIAFAAVYIRNRRRERDERGDQVRAGWVGMEEAKGASFTSSCILSRGRNRRCHYRPSGSRRLC